MENQAVNGIEAHGSKARELEEAIAGWVQPGSVLHIDSPAQAAYRALMRVFRGQKPGFTLIETGTKSTPIRDMIQAGMVKRIIATGINDPHVRPGTTAALQRVVETGEVAIEGWSLYTLLLRMMAGALGWGFIPTRCLVDSDMAAQNADAYLQINNPFDPGTPVQVLKPLVPDYSFVHAVWSDVAGNALFLPPYGGGLWGARASRYGAVVTTERLVDTADIRKHAHFVQLAAARVHAVVEVPFGAHPDELRSAYPDIIAGYYQDEDFFKAYAGAVKDPDRHQQWLEEWVYNPPSHDAYLQKVGRDRLDDLSSRSMAAVARGRPSTEAPGPSQQLSTEAQEAPPSLEERMIVATARRLVATVLEKGYDTILVGVGSAEVACALAFELLRQQNRHVQLVVGTGMIGFRPSPRDMHAQLGASTMLTGTDIAYGVVVGGPYSGSLGMLGASQVDRFGNLNTSETKNPRMLLTGSGGSNDTASLAKEVFVMIRYRPQVFLGRVDFVTSPGIRVTTVVTDIGIFEKESGPHELRLAATLGEGAERPDALEALAKLGWNVNPETEVKVEEPPTSTELQLLRAILRSMPGGASE